MSEDGFALPPHGLGSVPSLSGLFGFSSLQSVREARAGPGVPRDARQEWRLVGAIAKNIKTRNRIAQSGSQKHVRGEVRKCWNAREADGRGQSIRNPRDPAVVAITFGNDCSNRENTRRVAGRKTTALSEDRNRAFEKRIGKIVGRWNGIWAEPPTDQFYGHVRYRAVEVSLAHKKRGLLGIGTLAGDAVKIKRRRN